MLGKQAHSRLRNCFSSAAVELKDKSDSCIIEFSLLNIAKIDGSILTPPLIFSVLGLLLSQNSLALVDIHIDHHVIYIMAEITLVLVLFSDAARIDLRGLKTDYSLPVRMLLLGMPLTLVFGTVIAWVLPLQLTFWEGALVAAILAPTDAALGLSVIVCKNSSSNQC